MEPVVTMALVIASVLAALIVIDIGTDAVLKVAAIQWQRATPLRRVAAALLWLIAWVATARPPAAHGATPPPSLRIERVAGEPAHAEPPVPELPVSELPVSELPVSELPVSELPVPPTYEVQRGDCLWSIAKAILAERGPEPQGGDIAELWKAIYRANRDVIGDDPDLILPGQILELTEV
ncbi:MAG: LysM domain-containing protein [Acidimicrobiia bacterium]|nr:LysM domain-containing protein [Acidimicrobiia bacterium]